MQLILTKIRDGITEILPEAMGFEIHLETPLNEIPEWDSMTSVNFKVYLEETFRIKVPDELLEGDSKIGEVIEFIRRTD
jgi:acyl carrier protein